MDVDEEEEEYESGGEEEDQNMRSRTPVPPNFGLPPHIPTPTTTGTPPPPPSDPKLFDAASNVSDGEDEIESVPCRGIADIAITGDVSIHRLDYRHVLMCPSDPRASWHGVALLQVLRARPPV